MRAVLVAISPLLALVSPPALSSAQAQQARAAAPATIVAASRSRLTSRFRTGSRRALGDRARRVRSTRPPLRRGRILLRDGSSSPPLRFARRYQVQRNGRSELESGALSSPKSDGKPGKKAVRPKSRKRFVVKPKKKQKEKTKSRGEVAAKDAAKSSKGAAFSMQAGPDPVDGVKTSKVDVRWKLKKKDDDRKKDDHRKKDKKKVKAKKKEQMCRAGASSEACGQVASSTRTSAETGAESSVLLTSR